MAKIKICGLKQEQDIQYANACLPDYAGFIVNVPKSKRTLSPEAVQALCRKLSPGILKVGVFVNEPQKTLFNLKDCLDCIQVHGQEDNAYILEAKEKCGLPVIQAFRINKLTDFSVLEKSSADFLLLDSDAGSGTAFDWQLIPQITKNCSQPFFLAGGLNCGNLARALDTVKPFAVDISSGAETNGSKDLAKMKELVTITRRYSHE